MHESAPCGADSCALVKAGPVACWASRDFCPPCFAGLPAPFNPGQRDASREMSLSQRFVGRVVSRSTCRQAGQW